MLVDSHCHLDFDDFQDLDDVVGRARAAGVGRMVTICTRPSALPRVLDIVDAYDEVYCAVGVHPHNAAEFWPISAEEVLELAGRHPKIVGIGETGLDFHYDHSPRDIQAASFRVHAAAARRAGLPLIVHTRNADPETSEILAEEIEKGRDGAPLNGLIHCFSSGAELAENAIKMGFYVSLSGILTFNRSEDIRRTVAGLPEDRLLVETDAPYLSPVPVRGRRNEPAHVVHTAARLARVKGWTEDQAAQRTTENFFALFNRVPRI